VTHSTTIDICVEVNGDMLEIKAEVEYRYSPGRPAHTPLGEYAPIDPPEPPEIDFGPIVLITEGGDKSLPPRWLARWLMNSNAVFNELCEHAERHSGSDPDAEYERRRDDA
jgi:hypothetical protein